MLQLFTCSAVFNGEHDEMSASSGENKTVGVPRSDLLTTWGKEPLAAQYYYLLYLASAFPLFVTFIFHFFNTAIIYK